MTLGRGALRALEPDPGAQTTSPPTIGAVAERLYADMLPLAWLDDENDWSLAILCGSIGVLYQEVDDLVRDAPEGPGWSSVLDVTRCRADWLPWLGQFVGVTVPTGMSEANARSMIVARPGFQRGRPAAIVAAAQTTLTGTKTVYLQERFGADAYALAVRTVTSETPDAVATRAAILAAKPAGLILDYATVAGFSYDLLRVQFATYAAVKAAFATYDALRQGIHS